MATKIVDSWGGGWYSTSKFGKARAREIRALSRLGILKMSEKLIFDFNANAGAKSSGNSKGGHYAVGKGKNTYFRLHLPSSLADGYVKLATAGDLLVVVKSSAEEGGTHVHSKQSFVTVKANSELREALGTETRDLEVVETPAEAPAETVVCYKIA